MSHDPGYECVDNECHDFDDIDASATDEREPAGSPHPELGACLASFRGDITRNASWFGMLLMGLVVSGGLLGYMIHNDGLWPKDQGLAIGQLAMAGLVVTCVVLIVVAFRNANSRLLLFEKGLLNFRGQRLTEIKWDDVEAVFEGMSVTTYNHGVATQVKHKLRFRLKDQREARIDLSEYPDSEEVSGIVAQATVPRLMEEAEARLAAGQPADFGFVKVTNLGLERPGNISGTSVLGWRDVAEFNLDNGYLTIKSIKGWSSWAWKEVEQIPNLRVLVALLEQNTKGALVPASEAESLVPQLAGH